MLFNQVIFCKMGLDLNGAIHERLAARAVIIRDSDLYMVYSANVGDYKFPGGGVAAGESASATLARELREECGAKLMKLADRIGRIIEYDRAGETGVEIFKQTSDYYLCEIQEGVFPQLLEEYENELGFQPGWVSIKKAIAANLHVAKKQPDEKPRWLTREIYVLSKINDWIKSGSSFLPGISGTSLPIT